MTIKVGSARIDEHGRISGGAAGDQTGNELGIQSGYIYTGGWSVCIRLKNKSKRKKFRAFIEWACKNSLIGYDQNQRTTLYNELKRIGFDNYKKLSKKVECDCSSLVACGLIVAGYTKISPHCYTGNLEEAIKKAYPKDFSFFNSSYKNGNHTKIMKWWRNGDILLKKGHHVVTVVSGGRYSKKTSYYKKYTGASVKIDTVFATIGVPEKYRGSVAKRKTVAKKNGYFNYTGTAKQNTNLIKKAKKGKLKRP